MEGFPAVDVVDLAVELVGRPERPVQPAALHGVGAAEDVDGVPDDEREGDGHPEEGPEGGRVLPGDGGGGDALVVAAFGRGRRGSFGADALGARGGSRADHGGRADGW